MVSVYCMPFDLSWFMFHRFFLFTDLHFTFAFSDHYTLHCTIFADETFEDSY